MQHVKIEIIGRNLMPLLYYTHDCVEKLDIVLVELREKECYGIIVDIVEIEPVDFEVLEAKKSNYTLTDTQKVLLNFISSYYISKIGISLDLFVLCDKNIQKNITENSKVYDTNVNTLSEQQQIILNECRHKNISLIFGVTGSGKTEIYFHAIKECIESGKQALLLMPEISLTPQMQERLQRAFPNLSNIWHSKRSTKQKQEVLETLQSGHIKIIAGARSALFLPYDNLGLIIVDEEHDDSYKSSSQPKYNARDLAMFLSNKGIKVILGSATPSVKSYYIAKKHNYLLNLKHGFYVANQSLMYDETNQIGINQQILFAIKNEILQHKQVIVFVPTRANFKVIECRDCKHKITCPHCSISLSLHDKKNALICHYCNFMCKIPTQCEQCGNDSLSGIRIGTEEVKKQLIQCFEYDNIFPNIEIFDRDNITTQNKLEKTLKAFAKQEIDILIGTQMIAKGHDYPNVSLSVVIGIDYMLKIPDYRAYEICFSLLYQVAGRSGRKNDGKILIQTRDSNLINELWGDYIKVLNHEIESRDNLYPPFCKLAKLSFTSKNEKTAYNLACEFKEILENLKTSYINSAESKIMQNIKYVEIIGLCEANPFKTNQNYSYQILLRSYKNLALQNTILYALSLSTNDVVKSIDIDIDPLNI